MAYSKDGPDLPWWAFLAAAFFSVEYFLVQPSPGDALSPDLKWARPHQAVASLRSGIGENRHENMLSMRRLRNSSSGHAPKHVNVSLPCFKLPNYGNLIEPCGNITLGRKGVVVTTPFGNETLPAVDDLKPQLQATEDFMSHYTFIFVGVVAGIYVFLQIAIASNRIRMLKDARSIFRGNLEEHELDDGDEADAKQVNDEGAEVFLGATMNSGRGGPGYSGLSISGGARDGDDKYYCGRQLSASSTSTCGPRSGPQCASCQRFQQDQDERKADAADRLNPKSPHFIAPGNIYRVLAVVSPDKLGYFTYIGFAFKAVISAYMQLYIPWKIIKHTHSEWRVLGVKSPLWFLNNLGTFLSMMAALLSLCNMFARKCVRNIMEGAEANMYILTHQIPNPASGDRGPLLVGESTVFLRYPMLDKVNEYFWCCLSLLINVCMSAFLQVCMFLKIATFTGAVDQVAVVAVSLYFVFDLDSKVLDGDPHLKTMYRRAVLKQTEERAYKPTWIASMALAACALLKMTVPFGLLAIVLLSWRNHHTGFVIGGDGLTRK